MTLALGAELDSRWRRAPLRCRPTISSSIYLEPAIEPGELLVAIHNTGWFSANHRWAFRGLARRARALRLVGCSILAEFVDDVVKQVRIALLLRWQHADACAAGRGQPGKIGKRLDQAAIAAAQAVVGDDLDPPEDEHTPPAMKRHLARVLPRPTAGRDREAGRMSDLVNVTMTVNGTEVSHSIAPRITLPRISCARRWN